MNLGNTGKLEPSRRGSGNFEAIYKDPKSLLSPESYFRRLLFIISDKWLGSEETKNKFNELFGSEYTKSKTQGSVSNYLSQLYSWGLVDHDKIAEQWRLKPALDVNDGQLLYRIATERIAELRKLAEN